MHGNSCCTCSTIFPFLTNDILALWSCRSRSSRLCLNSLMTLVGTKLNLGEKMKIYPQVLTSFIKPQIWLFEDDGKVMGQKRKTHVQGMQSYCFCPLIDVLVAVAVVVAQQISADLLPRQQSVVDKLLFVLLFYLYYVSHYL